MIIVRVSSVYINRKNYEQFMQNDKTMNGNINISSDRQA
jgi:hypothetical protein